MTGELKLSFGAILPFCKKQWMWAMIWSPVWPQGVSVITVISPSLFVQVARTRLCYRTLTASGFASCFFFSAKPITSHARYELTFVGQKRDTFFVISGYKQFVILPLYFCIVGGCHAIIFDFVFVIWLAP